VHNVVFAEFWTRIFRLPTLVPLSNWRYVKETLAGVEPAGIVG
jgi:hypothetical protein